MECDKCNALIPAGTKRFLCRQEECAYHVCSKCRSGMATGGGEEMSLDLSKRARESGATPM
eukprot:5545072-Karenia_brevis.AAC.1